ncbi:MAG: transposase, partial [Candidatus Eisenbacteria sp.]|nr:transposase [Candidatus Eisenbacteria bacterium]
KLLEVIDRVELVTGKKVERITADKGYAHPGNYGGCEERGIQAIIPPVRIGGPQRRMMARRFRYDALHKILRCPMGKILRPSSRKKNGWIYRARTRDCMGCMHQENCVSPGRKARTVPIADGHEALLRARRRWPDRDEETRRLYARHRWRAEGKHGEAKTQHGLRRAVRRGLPNVAIQSFLTAAVMNLKALAGLLSWLFYRLSGSQDALVELQPFPNRDFDQDRVIGEYLDRAA